MGYLDNAFGIVSTVSILKGRPEKLINGHYPHTSGWKDNIVSVQNILVCLRYTCIICGRVCEEYRGRTVANIYYSSLKTRERNLCKCVVIQPISQSLFYSR